MNGTNQTNQTERLKSKQKCPVVGKCPKSELFGNGTILKSAEIGTFGFWRSTVIDLYRKNQFISKNLIKFDHF